MNWFIAAFFLSAAAIPAIAGIYYFVQLIRALHALARFYDETM